MGKDIGYLPGTKEEKLAPWMRAIYDNLEFAINAGYLFAGDAMDFFERDNRDDLTTYSNMDGSSDEDIFISTMRTNKFTCIKWCLKRKDTGSSCCNSAGRLKFIFNIKANVIQN